MKVRFVVTVEGLHRDTKPYRVQTLACVELTRALRHDYAHVHDVSEINVSVSGAEVLNPAKPTPRLHGVTNA